MKLGPNLSLVRIRLWSEFGIWSELSHHPQKPCLKLFQRDGCFLGVDEGQMTYEEQHWHATPECFSCFRCQKPLLGLPFLPKRGAIFCSLMCGKAEGQHSSARKDSSPSHANINLLNTGSLKNSPNYSEVDQQLPFQKKQASFSEGPTSPFQQPRSKSDSTASLKPLSKPSVEQSLLKKPNFNAKNSESPKTLVKPFNYTPPKTSLQNLPSITPDSGAEMGSSQQVPSNTPCSPNRTGVQAIDPAVVITSIHGGVASPGGFQFKDEDNDSAVSSYHSATDSNTGTFSSQEKTPDDLNPPPLPPKPAFMRAASSTHKPLPRKSGNKATSPSEASEVMGAEGSGDGTAPRLHSPRSLPDLKKSNLKNAKSETINSGYGSSGNKNVSFNPFVTERSRSNSLPRSTGSEDEYELTGINSDSEDNRHSPRSRRSGENWKHFSDVRDSSRDERRRYLGHKDHSEYLEDRRMHPYGYFTDSSSSSSDDDDVYWPQHLRTGASSSHGHMHQRRKKKMSKKNKCKISWSQRPLELWTSHKWVLHIRNLLKLREQITWSLFFLREATKLDKWWQFSGFLSLKTHFGIKAQKNEKQFLSISN